MRRLGLGSYACAWAVSVGSLDAFGILDEARALGLRVVQLADNVPLLESGKSEIERLRESAAAAQIEIELGMRGLTAGKVRAYLDLCLALGVRLLRIVVDDASHQPSCKAIVATLRAVVPDLTCAGLTLAIENHERFRAHTLSRMVQELDHPSIGICFDTVNSFGALEGPEHVIEKLGPAVVNLHVKDFVIAREPHQMGFRITGAPAGHGMLDIPGLLAKLDALKARGNAILELWPPPEATTEETIAKEKRWREQSVEYLRTLIAN